MSGTNPYQTPEVTEHGSVEAMTKQNDKIGSATDSETTAANDLDGVIQPD